MMKVLFRIACPLQAKDLVERQEEGHNSLAVQCHFHWVVVWAFVADIVADTVVAAAAVA